MAVSNQTLKRTAEEIYQLKIMLKGSKPPIWRRVQVRAEMTLAQLHEVIQIVMGWTDSHLHGVVARIRIESCGHCDVVSFSCNEKENHVPHPQLARV